MAASLISNYASEPDKKGHKKKVEAADAQRRYDEQKHVETMRALTQPAQACTADELTKLAALKAAGALTEEEFTQQKARLLSR